MNSQGSRRRKSRVVLIHLLYDILFLTIIVLGLPYILYRLATNRRYRAGIDQRLGFIPKHQRIGPVIWVHGVSVGEIKTVLPILKRIEAAYPKLEWAVSTTTQAGFQMANILFGGKYIFYFPLDIGFIVRRVIRRIRPDFIILMELEIWPNLLYEADRMGTPVVIINGRISEKSYQGYRRLRKLLPEMDRIGLFSVQNEEYRDRLLALEVPPERIEVTGNIKYDGIDTKEVTDLSAIRNELKLSGTNRVLVAGSTHSGEDGILLDLYRSLVLRYPEFRIVLVPRHIERTEEIERECTQRKLFPVRRTALDRKQTVLSGEEVLIVDTIGELDRFYSAADLVFVGGSLVPVGGHNMMEPAGKGKPVLFGPHIQNFQEDVALLEAKRAAVMVRDGEELEAFIERLLEDKEEARRLGRAAREVIFAAKGATERNFELLDRKFLKVISRKPR